jgi:four helix bundle protein
MALKFEELRVLQAAEVVADGLWRLVGRWEPFAREVVGGQMARAADSIGANIAEAYGRFHYGEKLQFLYYARGSLFETKYWLNRARERNPIPPALAEEYASQLTDLARQLNAFATDLKPSVAAARNERKRCVRMPSNTSPMIRATSLCRFSPGRISSGSRPSPIPNT